MKKYVLLLSTFAILSQNTSAQTRKIMHRSHSGKDRSFMNDNSEDNFGISRDIKVNFDSIRFQPDSTRHPAVSDSTRRPAHKPATKPQTRPATKPKR